MDFCWDWSGTACAQAARKRRVPALPTFAQSEREVTAERIRDKVAASKRRGLRMGGPVPLGYAVRDKKLVPHPDEAETVRLIFRRYGELGCLSALMGDLAQQGIVTKRSPRRDGSTRGGIPFSKGPLAFLLRNRTYAGEVVHKDRYYPGEHEAIVPGELFQAVQQALDAKAHRAGIAALNDDALLRGLLFDERGRPMVSGMAKKNGARYRYYVSSTPAQGQSDATENSRCCHNAGSRPQLIRFPRPFGPVKDHTLLTLFHAPRSRSTRIVWLLEELATPYELHHVTIRYMDGSGKGPDPANPHPDKRVPALLHDGALITESAAVAIYLADLVPAARLAPDVGDRDRGPYLTWMSWIEGEFGPAIFQRLAVGAGAPSAAAFVRAMQRLDHDLTTGPFLLGERFSAADVMLGGTLGWAREILPSQGPLSAYLARLAARPAFGRAMARDAAPGARTP